MGPHDPHLRSQGSKGNLDPRHCVLSVHPSSGSEEERRHQHRHRREAHKGAPYSEVKRAPRRGLVIAGASIFLLCTIVTRYFPKATQATIVNIPPTL